MRFAERSGTPPRQIIACPTDRGSRAAPIQDQSSRTMIIVLRAVDVERQVRIGQAGATCKDELYDELRFKRGALYRGARAGAVIVGGGEDAHQPFLANPQNAAQQIVMATSAPSPNFERTRTAIVPTLIAATPSVTTSQGVPDAKKSPGLNNPHSIHADVTPTNAPVSARSNPTANR